VVDTGVGIALEKQESLFEEFKMLGSIRISYALPDGIEQKVNAGGAHGPSRLSGLAV